MNKVKLPCCYRKYEMFTSTENLPLFYFMHWCVNFVYDLAMRLQNRCVWRNSTKNALDYDTAINC